MPTCFFDTERGHNLLPDSQARSIPPLYTHDGKGIDAPIAVKFFGPGRFTFYVTEFDGKDELFGFCVSQHGPDCDEWSYASLNEFAHTRHPNFPITQQSNATAFSRPVPPSARHSPATPNPPTN